MSNNYTNFCKLLWTDTQLISTLNFTLLLIGVLNMREIFKNGTRYNKELFHYSSRPTLHPI